MQFKPVPVSADVGFSDNVDLFGYKQFGDRLTNVISSLEQPTTLVLDGPWGSGKSTFLRQWVADLRKDKHPVILFDAFASDFFDDAFIPLSAEILKLTESRVPKRSRFSKIAKESTARALKVIAPITAKAGVRIMSLGMLDYADIKEGAESISETLSHAFGDVAEQAAINAIENAMEQQGVLDKFRSDIEALVTQYQKERSKDNLPNCPVLFVIDELDRCKPTFALNLIERIKHLFEINGVVFLLVTNLKQMRAAVRGAYGESTDAATYLEKFYDLRLTLPVLRLESRIEAYVNYLQDHLSITTGDSHSDMAINDMLIGFFTSHKIELRSIERIHAHLLVNTRSLAKNQLKLAPLIAGLCILRHLRPELFDDALEGKLMWKEVSEFFQFEQWAKSRSYEWFANWWRYLTDPELESDNKVAEDMRRSISQYNIRDSRELLKWGARRVVEFDILPS
ncbi:KAP family P-loop NTPase fold protein [Thalassospira povalilytica]|uniref:KAP family P-loop NTPase fold protein n=1 Tax=Thalassospira povalilytica TaxID=732237 RepID=UPI003AA99B7F